MVGKREHRQGLSRAETSGHTGRGCSLLIKQIFLEHLLYTRCHSSDNRGENLEVALGFVKGARDFISYPSIAFKIYFLPYPFIAFVIK